MKKRGIPSREEREKAKKAHLKNKVMSFTVSPNLKQEIDDLQSMVEMESRSEFLRTCISVNKILMKYAKDGFTELIIQKPGSKERKFIHLNHLFVTKEKGDDNSN